MAFRDSDPAFDSVKNKGIGIPAFVHEDGTVTLIPEDVGLKSRQEALLEEQRKGSSKEVFGKDSKKNCPIASYRCCKRSQYQENHRYDKEEPICITVRFSEGDKSVEDAGGNNLKSLEG